MIILSGFPPWKGGTDLQPWQSWNDFNSTAIGLHSWKIVQKAVTEDSKNWSMVTWFLEENISMSWIFLFVERCKSTQLTSQILPVFLLPKPPSSPTGESPEDTKICSFQTPSITFLTTWQHANTHVRLWTVTCKIKRAWFLPHSVVSSVECFTRPTSWVIVERPPFYTTSPNPLVHMKLVTFQHVKVPYFLKKKKKKVCRRLRCIQKLRKIKIPKEIN